MEEIDLGVCAGRLFPGSSRAAAIVLPGARYLPGYPLLWFTRTTLCARDWTVLEVWDEWRGGSDPAAWVAARATAALARLDAAAQPMLVGKSISSHAASVAAERALPGIWLTPLLTTDAVFEAVRRSSAPMLLVGGSADAVWDEARARQLARALTIPDANHSLEIAGDPIASLDALRSVVEAIGAFVDGLG